MRKDLLASSLKAVRDGKLVHPADAEAPRRLVGILDVQRGLDQLASGAPRSIDPASIADSSIRDRFDVHDGIEDLVESIRTSGQRLPVLVRRIKHGPLPYEVVYGRRRIEACRVLGIEVLAYVTDMEDREALISQGLENAARLQRSFIEQAVYAERLIEHGLSRDEVMSVLAIDKTTLSRMLTVVNTVPAALIEAIGPAHDAGRRPWQDLREAIQKASPSLIDELPSLVDRSKASSERLSALLRSLSAKLHPKPPKEQRARPLVHGFHLERSSNAIALKPPPGKLDEFADFLDARLDALLDEFINTQNGAQTTDDDRR